MGWTLGKQELVVFEKKRTNHDLRKIIINRLNLVKITNRTVILTKAIYTLLDGIKNGYADGFCNAIPVPLTTALNGSSDT